MSKITNYNEVSKSYDSSRGPTDAYMLKSMMENFTGKDVKDMDMVDIGCGTGNYAEYFLQFEPRSLTLMDGSEGMLGKAKAKLPSDHQKTRLSFKQVVLPDIPYEDNLFDAAMINMVLHHLEENPNGKSFPVLSKTLKEVYRILKPGGVLTITCCTPEVLEAIWYSHLVPENTQRWRNRLASHTQMKACLEKAGFSLKSAFTSILPSHVPPIHIPEEVKNESFRQNISFWGTCTKSEIEDMIRNVTRMENEGTLQEYYEAHDKTNTFGLLEILAAKKEMK